MWDNFAGRPAWRYKRSLQKMRINKYIAQAGVASRRKADELIANGNVKVNGAVMKEPGL